MRLTNSGTPARPEPFTELLNVGFLIAESPIDRPLSDGWTSGGDQDWAAGRRADAMVTAGSFTAAARKKILIRIRFGVPIDVWRRSGPVALNRNGTTLVSDTIDYPAAGGERSASAMIIRLDRYRRPGAGPTHSNEAA